jgi:hemoglobin
LTGSLYLRLGGAPGIVAIVDDLVDRHAANPLLAPRFGGKDLPELKARSVDFFTARSGGASQGGPGGEHLAHAGMQFDGRELAAVIDDIVAALQEFGLETAEVDDVVALLRVPHAAVQAGNERGTQAA